MRALGHLFLLLLAVGSISAAAWRNDALRVVRRDLHISQADPFENAPPLVAFTTVALGGFRGILADLLWLRAGRLQEEGKYFELVQLADWITKLEPRFTSVWAYQAWNLAYNISVLFDQPEDRWRWVSSGMKLLRDEGLKYNPGDARLVYELGWMFSHKIGGSSDQMHLHYKRAWALEMSSLFDGPRPDFADAATSKKLLETYKLDPALMKTVDEEFGPLDWRLPQAHAIYWAVRSRAIASGFDAVAAERMIFQSMADAFRQGSLYTAPGQDIFIPSPNLALLPRVRKAYEDAMALHPDQETYKTAHRNFLGSAIVMLYTYHRVEEARSLFDDLRRNYPDDVGGQTFDGYVLKNFAADVKDLTDRDALAFVEGAFSQSLFWQAFGDPDRAAGFAALAQLTWHQYMALRTSPEFKERTGLPPLNEIRDLALARMREQFPAHPAVTRLEGSRPPPGPAQEPRRE